MTLGSVTALTSATRLAAANTRLQAEVRARWSTSRLPAAGSSTPATRNTERLERRLHEEQVLALRRWARPCAAAEDVGLERQTTDESFARRVRSRNPWRSGVGSHEGSIPACSPSMGWSVRSPPSWNVPGPRRGEVETAIGCRRGRGRRLLRVRRGAGERGEVFVRVEGQRVRHRRRRSRRGGGRGRWSGGADPARGSGLRGLADRVATLRGTIRVGTAAGGGTRLTAEIPLGGENL